MLSLLPAALAMTMTALRLSVYYFYLFPISWDVTGFCCVFIGMVVAAVVVVVLEVRLMIVTPQKELAMEVNARIEEDMTRAAVVEDMAAVTEAMEDQIAVTHPLIGVMALPLIVPGLEAMVEGHQLIGRTLQAHILEVGLRTFEYHRDVSIKIIFFIVH